MYCIDANIDRPLRAREPMSTNAALRRKVPNTRATWISVHNQNVRRKLVGRVDQAAGSLKPWLKMLRSGQEVPAEDDRGETDPTVGAAALRT